VVFNLFQAATHFATQFNLLNPFRKFSVRHTKCNCVCTISNSCTWQHRWRRLLPYKLQI